MKSYIEKYPYLTIFIAWLFIFVAHLGLLYPNIMEARNFITAREMLTDGNWILTTMDGLPRYEKPPLPTWLAAISGRVFGIDNITALRFPSALVTLLLMFVFFLFSNKLTKHKTYSLIATLVLGTSFYIVFAGRNGTWDIFAHTFTLCGVYFMYSFFKETNAIYKNAILAGVFVGLSFMSKGPVSHYALLLPFLIAFGFSYGYRNFNKKWGALAVMILIIAILSSWWALYIWKMDTSEATRIAEKESGRWLDYEVKPFYYYWSFFTQSGVWTIPAFVCLFFPYLKKRVLNPKAYKFVFLWTVSVVICLSLIPTKKSRYLLPVLIPLAATIAFYIEYLFRAFKTMTHTWEKLPVYFNYGLIALIGIIFPLGAYLYFGDKLEGLYVDYALTSITLFSTGIFIFYHLLKRNISNVFFGTIAFMMFVISLGFPLSKAILGNSEYNEISKLRESNVPVYSLHGLTPELVWNYGKATNKITEEQLLKFDTEEKVGILTRYALEKNELDFLKEGYDIRWKETFDLNPVDTTKRANKSRLKTDYYILTKKEK